MAEHPPFKRGVAGSSPARGIMKLISKQRKNHIEWFFYDLEEIKEVKRFDKDYVFIPKGKYIIEMRIHDVCTNSILYTVEVLSENYPVGYNFDFPVIFNDETKIGDFLGTNEHTWFSFPCYFLRN